MTNYAIICTGSWGDVINTTPLAAQIKAENSSDQVHWYVSNLYRSAIHLNPHIDQVFDLSSTDKADSLGPCTARARELAQKTAQEIGGYRTIFVPAPYMNYHWFEQRLHIVDCIKQACNDAHPGINWKVPWIPTLQLKPEEVEKARSWRAKYADKKIAIFEYDAKSGQCQIQPHWIPAVCKLFGPEWIVALAGLSDIHHPLPSNAIPAGNLSIRCTAELFNHADFMVGVSSGISAACSSTWTVERAKNMPWIEICNNILWSGSIYKQAPRTIYTGTNLETLLAMIRPLVK